MGARTAAAYFHVPDKTGNAVWFAPGEEVPGWAQKLVKNDAVLTEPDDSEESDDAGDKPYAKRTNDELVAELESRGLDTAGKKADLVARLEEADAAGDTDADLKAELVSLGLSIDGTHEELVERLADHKE